LCVVKEKAVIFLQKMAEQLQLPYKVYRVCLSYDCTLHHSLVGFVVAFVLCIVTASVSLLNCDSVVHIQQLSSRELCFWSVYLYV